MQELLIMLYLPSVFRMKKIVAFLIITAAVSCKKENVNENIGSPNNNGTPEQHTSITYPDSLNGYRNVLSFASGETFHETDSLEIGADLEADAHLKLVITNYPVLDSTGQDLTYWMYSSATGFTVSDFDTATNTQTLISSVAGKIFMPIFFIANGQGGHCKIDYYENSTSITRTRDYQWQN
jgi:hypothetical protein